jgi:hypothetical protein
MVQKNLSAFFIYHIGEKTILKKEVGAGNLFMGSIGLKRLIKK